MKRSLLESEKPEIQFKSFDLKKYGFAGACCDCLKKRKSGASRKGQKIGIMQAAKGLDKEERQEIIMDQALKERLEILKTAGLMEAPIEETVQHICRKLESDGVAAEDEKVGMFLTHLAAALNRIKQGKAIQEPNEALMEELRENKHYPKAKEYFEEITRLSSMELDAGEEAYVGGYLCILLAQGKEGNG